MVERKAIIVGCRGQDGSYLSENLRAKKYRIIGIDELYLYDDNAEVIGPFDTIDTASVAQLLSREQPDEIYYLAAVHQSSEEAIYDDLRLFNLSMKVHVIGLNNFLGAIVKYCPKARLFYAASSHLFSGKSGEKQDENTPREPGCIYSITKSAGVDLCHYYRREHCVYCTVGYLYNHESPRRNPRFVSRKIVIAAVKIKYGLSDKLVIGNLDAQVDWGFAPDYVEAMTQVLQVSAAQDFIISSGELHTVKDFLKLVFDYLDLNWKRYVEIDATLIKKSNRYLHGNNTKIRELTGWKPTITFSELVKVMVDEEMKSFGKQHPGFYSDLQ